MSTRQSEAPASFKEIIVSMHGQSMRAQRDQLTIANADVVDL